MACQITANGPVNISWHFNNSFTDIKIVNSSKHLIVESFSGGSSLMSVLSLQNLSNGTDTGRYICKGHIGSSHKLLPEPFLYVPPKNQIAFPPIFDCPSVALKRKTQICAEIIPITPPVSIISKTITNSMHPSITFSTTSMSYMITLPTPTPIPFATFIMEDLTSSETTFTAFQSHSKSADGLSEKETTPIMTSTKVLIQPTSSLEVATIVSNINQPTSTSLQVATIVSQPTSTSLQVATIVSGIDTAWLYIISSFLGALLIFTFMIVISICLIIYLYQRSISSRHSSNTIGTYYYFNNNNECSRYQNSIYFISSRSCCFKTKNTPTI